ncbi:hypothetical protein AX14_007104 [Amanita brunnescens Koide BX004]|nr:hypothetical protein AX14_007104 [Amanita brunnescens Koide BX004]
MLPALSRSVYRSAAVVGTRTTRRSSGSIISYHRYHSTRSTMSGDDPEILELEKRRNLSNTQHHTSTPISNAPGWNEVLATESEAFVKADQGHQASETVGELQAKTIEYLRTRHNPDDRTGSTVAEYAREEVMGPLSGAQGKEDSNTDADDMDTNSIHRQRCTVEAFSAGGDTMIRETLEEEDTTQVHKKREITPENPTPSEEAVRADTGKPIYT